MLELRRLRLLSELARRGTIAAVADALQFTPSAVSQQLAMLEREAGVKLIERAGRGVRLTDPARVLVAHADALLDRAALAEADLAAAAGAVSGRGRIAGFQSVATHLAIPAIAELARTAPRLRCELVEAEPEQSLPALSRGDLDLVLGDEWPDEPRHILAGLVRHELMSDPLHLVLPADHPQTRARRTDLGELAGDAWVTGPVGLGWDEMTRGTCLRHGGFEPDIRYRTNDANLALVIIAAGLAVGMLPALPLLGHGRDLVLRRLPGERRIFAATRATDARRPSTRALLDALSDATAALGNRFGADGVPAA